MRIARIKQLIINMFMKWHNKKSNRFGAGIKFDTTVHIGKNVVVGNHATIVEESVLGDDVAIGDNTVLSRVAVGKGSHIEYGVVVTGYGNGKIQIGENSYIGIYCVMDWSDNLTIGNYVHIAGPSTGLWTHTSVRQALAGDMLSDKSKRETSPIIIEDNVYIGGNCTIYPGVTIGHHSIIAPNSAVTKDVPSYTMVGGVPAVYIKKIKLNKHSTRNNAKHER
ncbi:MAG: DapH/DapD/GlmU-related protein [Bacteroidota bacterium]|jgi:acetyltransferase-like isoleucine patch superfamily enzyme